MSCSQEQELWQEVLRRQIDDALIGPTGVNKANRIAVIEQARRYLTVPNQDFDLVCTYAGLEPDAVREHLSKKIADAPTPEAMLSTTSKYSTPKTAPKPVAPRKHRRPTIMLHLDGQDYTLTQLSKRYGVNRQTLRKRIEAGWPVGLAVNVAPIRGGIRPGVVSDFGGLQGTGGGRSAQDTPKISFPELKVNA